MGPYRTTLERQMSRVVVLAVFSLTFIVYVALAVRSNDRPSATERTAPRTSTEPPTTPVKPALPKNLVRPQLRAVPPSFGPPLPPEYVDVPDALVFRSLLIDLAKDEEFKQNLVSENKFVDMYDRTSDNTIIGHNYVGGAVTVQYDQIDLALGLPFEKREDWIAAGMVEDLRRRNKGGSRSLAGFKIQSPSYRVIKDSEPAMEKPDILGFGVLPDPHGLPKAYVSVWICPVTPGMVAPRCSASISDPAYTAGARRHICSKSNRMADGSS